MEGDHHWALLFSSCAPVTETLRTALDLLVQQAA